MTEFPFQRPVGKAVQPQIQDPHFMTGGNYGGQIAQFQRCLSNNGGNPCVLPTAPEGWSITVEKPSAQTEAR